MNYKIKKDYISTELCQTLSDDFASLTASDTIRFHGGRKLIPNTSVEFAELTAKSKAWRDLSKELCSEGFSQLILDESKISGSKIKTTNYFSYLASIFPGLRKRSLGIIRNANPLFLIYWAFYSVIVRASAVLYAFLYRLIGYELAELLYDASSASNGYSREIHRDSDSRIYVFLLYLNEIASTDSSSGGELCIHKFSNPSGQKAAQPDIIDAPIEISIKPRPGTLVFFENDEDAVHSVSRMEGFVGERFFIYGSLTLLNGKNHNFIKTKESLLTDFRMYL